MTLSPRELEAVLSHLAHTHSGWDAHCQEMGVSADAIALKLTESYAEGIKQFSQQFTPKTHVEFPPRRIA